MYIFIIYLNKNKIFYINHFYVIFTWNISLEHYCRIFVLTVTALTLPYAAFNSVLISVLISGQHSTVKP